MKIGIIDIGGGLRDIYGAGVFDRLLDDGVQFDYCIGVSAGSANIASYIAGQRGRNYRFYIDYSKRNEYMSAANYLRIGSFLDLHYIYGTLSNADGEDPLDYDTFLKSKTEMVVVATDAKTGEVCYFTKEDVKRNDYRVLMASSAIPVFTRYESIGEGLYTDGGVSEPIPIGRAIEDGCDKVVLVLTKPDGPMKPKKRDQLGSVLLRRSRPPIADLMGVRHEVYNHQLALAHKLADEGKCLIISPQSTFGIKTLTNDTTALQRLYEAGYDDAAQVAAFVQGRAE